MKRLTTLLAALVIATLPVLAQSGKWERASVTPYGTGRTTSGDVVTEHVYSNGSFNSEMKSNTGKFVYFRKGYFNEPAASYRPGQTFTVNMRLTLKRHSGNGKPSGTAGADLVSGAGGRNTSISPDIKISGVDTEKSASVQLNIPSRAAAGKDQMSIVYQCLDMTVVYLYKWVPDQKEEPKPQEQAEAPKQKGLPEPEAQPEVEEPVVDEPAAPAQEEDAYNWDEPAEAVSGDDDFDDWGDFDTPMTEEDAMKMMAGAAKDAVKEKVSSTMDKVLFSAFGKDFTMKETIIYGGGGLLGLIILIILLCLIFRSNPQKKAAKQAAKQAAMAQAAQMRAQQQAARAEAQRAQQEAMAARKAEMEAKRAEAMKAQQEAAAARKAEMEAKRAAAMAAAQARRAGAAAPQAAAPAPQPQPAPAPAPAPQPQPTPAPAPQPAPAPAPQPAPAPVIPSEAKESSAPAVRFCENCGAKLDPDAAFCPECGSKVN